MGVGRGMVMGWHVGMGRMWVSVGVCAGRDRDGYRLGCGMGMSGGKEKTGYGFSCGYVSRYGWE